MWFGLVPYTDLFSGPFKRPSSMTMVSDELKDRAQ